MKCFLDRKGVGMQLDEKQRRDMLMCSVSPLSNWEWVR